MPVIATPITPGSSGGGAQGAAQLTKTPHLTRVEGDAVPAKMQAIRVSQTQLATIDWTMKAQNGAVVDLTTLAGATVQLAVRETLSMNASNLGVVMAGSIADASVGFVQATLASDAVAYPGISYAEFGIFLNGALVFSNVFYLIIEPSQFSGNNLTPNGPPTIPELRLFLRDVDPAGNLWVQSFEWDLAEMAACISRPIYEFNEAPPPLDQTWTTASFPWRHNWMKASCGYLMRMAADWYRRVHLPYGGIGGITTDDKKKFQEYDARGKELIDEWKEWLRFKKVQLNMEAWVGCFGSSYDNRYDIGGW